MSIVSCQSHVAHGHVGNAAAVFAMQRMGHEVCAVNTLQFSNHPGYGDAGGGRFDAAHLRSVMAGLERRGVLRDCAAVLTGYLGGVDAGAVLAETLERLPVDNPLALVCCDPVAGDHDTGMFVDADVAELIRTRLVPRARLVTPNHFELGWLVGEAAGVLPEPVAAARDLAGRLGALVLVTGVEPPDDPQRIHSLLVGDGVALRVACPKVTLGRRPDGAGDLFAAVFLARYIEDWDGPGALSHAAGAVHDVLVETARIGTRELALIAAQGALVEPSLALDVSAV